MTPQDQKFVTSFKPRNKTQRLALKLFDSSRIMFLMGSAGCGKTFISMALAMQAYKERKVSKIYVTRPLIEAAGERMGFLPGTVEEKVAPYLTPIHHVLGKIVFRVPDKALETMPLAFMRGITFENCIAVLDEAQNCTYQQLKLFLSRMGPNSKLLICGDPQQSDIEPSDRHDYFTDLEYVAEQLQELPGVSVLDFTSADQVRDPFLTKILEKLP